jgi:hypothetical protein
LKCMMMHGLADFKLSQSLAKEPCGVLPKFN